MTLKTKDSRAELKTRAYPFQVKAVDEAGTFSGYASVFGVRDSYNEVVLPGAFSDSLARHKREGTFPLMLWQHDPWEVPGKWNDFSDDGKGLFAEGRLLLELQRGKEAHILLREKAISGLSIGYREVDVEPAKDGEPRRLIKLDLMEVSIVSFPANRRARVDVVKNESWGKLESLARKFRDGEPLPAKDYEEILREAGFPKSAAVQIASHGYAKAIRSESGGDEASNRAVRAFLDNLSSDLAQF